jgi:glycosyltransferase involved in cell wall biosynthesis
MRVLHVTTSSAIGGAERLLVDMLRHQKEEVRSTVCTVLPRGPLHDELQSLRVTSHSLGLSSARGVAHAVVKLALLIRRSSFDVVHTHLLHGSVIGLLAARVARVPVSVMTRHNANYLRLYGSVTERALDRLCNRLADRIFAVSQAARAELLAEGVEPARVQVIPNGIDVERIRLLASQSIPSRATAAIRLGNVASLQARKGHSDLLAALRLLLKGGLDVNLVVAGDGPLLSSLQAMVRAQNLTESVRLIGHVQNPYSTMSDIDIYVQPSLEEGFGIAVLEAMALEKLVEVVVDRETGLLVQPGQPDELARALSELALSPHTRQVFGLHGRNRVETMFRASDTAAAYSVAYRTLLAAHGTQQ